MQLVILSQKRLHCLPQIHELLGELSELILDCFLLKSKPIKLKGIFDFHFSLSYKHYLPNFLVFSVLLVQNSSDYFYKFLRFYCCL